MATPSPPILLTLAGLAGLAATAGPLPAQEPPPPPSEGPPPTVRHVEVEGLDRLDPPVRLPRRLPLRPGASYTIEAVEETDAVIVGAFAERGRPYVSVEVDVEIDPGAATASVRIEVTDAGPPVQFGPVRVMGQPPLDEGVIRERIAYAPGDPYRPSRMEETRDRLLTLPVVAEAIVFPVGLEARETIVSTIVSVATVPRPREPDLSGTLSSVRCLELRAFWRDRYFLDGPRFFSVGVGAENLLAAQVGNRFPCSDVGEDDFADPGYFVSTELRHPWPGRPLTTVTAALSFQRRSAPRAYVLRTAAARLDLRRVLGRDMLVAVAYAPERTEVRAAGFYFCATFGACSASEIERLQSARRLAPLELAVQWIPRRTREAVTPRPALPGLPPPLDPRREAAPPVPGWRPWVYVEAQGAGRWTGSSLGWRRIEVEGAAARFVGDRSEVVLRGRIGSVGRSDGFLLPQLRFYSGGPSSVRGVGHNLLGPLVLVTSVGEAAELGCALEAEGCPPGTIAHPDLASPRPRGAGLVIEGNVEARVRLTSRIQLAGFADYGFLRADDRISGTERTRPGEGVATPGIGVRIVTPLGLFRVDAGYDPRGPRPVPLLSPGLDDGNLLFLGDVVWAPHTHDSPSTLRRFLRRIQLGIAVGQPF